MTEIKNITTIEELYNEVSDLAMDCRNTSEAAIKSDCNDYELGKAVGLKWASDMIAEILARVEC